MNIVIKISGEFINNSEILDSIISQIDSLVDSHKIAIVVGGGNLIRGRDSDNNQRSKDDRLGIYSTLINGLILKKRLSNAKVFNSFDSYFLDKYSGEQLDKFNPIIFTGGIGIPYFSTDIAAVVRALDVNADLILKMTKVDGVFSSDPNLGDAEKYDSVSYDKILSENLTVIDSTAAALAKSHSLKMIIFNGFVNNSISRALKGEIGTTIS